MGRVIGVKGRQPEILRLGETGAFVPRIGNGVNIIVGRC